MVEPTVQNIGINRRHFAKLEYWKTHCHVCGWKRSLNVSGMSMQSIPPSSINSHQRKQSHFRKYQPNITKHQLAHACKPSPKFWILLCQHGHVPSYADCILSLLGDISSIQRFVFPTPRWFDGLVFQSPFFSSMVIKHSYGKSPFYITRYR